MFAGPLTAATAIRPGCAAISAATSSSEAKTAAMVPGSENSWMTRARSTAKARPSSSDIAPATQAATHSPKLWPRTAAGVMPHERHSWAIAYSTTKVAGWA